MAEKMNPYVYKAKILRVVDGDTVDIDLDLGFGVIYAKQRVRLLGIDTPESRTRDLEEKKKGLAAKERLIEILKANDNKFVLKSHGVGKYGRCLGELHIDVVDGQEKMTLESVNELLIKEGHAVEYHGGKNSFES